MTENYLYQTLSESKSIFGRGDGGGELTTRPLPKQQWRLTYPSVRPFGTIIASLPPTNPSQSYAVGTPTHRHLFFPARRGRMVSVLVRSIAPHLRVWFMDVTKASEFIYIYIYILRSNLVDMKFHASHWIPVLI